MGSGNWKSRVLSVFVLFIFMAILSCFAAGNSGKEKPDEEAVPSETVPEKGIR